MNKFIEWLNEEIEDIDDELEQVISNSAYEGRLMGERSAYERVLQYLQEKGLKIPTGIEPDEK